MTRSFLSAVALGISFGPPPTFWLRALLPWRTPLVWRKCPPSTACSTTTRGAATDGLRVWLQRQLGWQLAGGDIAGRRRLVCRVPHSLRDIALLVRRSPAVGPQRCASHSAQRRGGLLVAGGAAVQRVPGIERRLIAGIRRPGTRCGHLHTVSARVGASISSGACGPCGASA